MILIKKIIYLFILLLAARASAQDYPPSVGPAPLVNNYIPTSEQVFPSANPNNRALALLGSGSTTTAYTFKHFLNSCSLTLIGQQMTYVPGAITRVARNKYYILDQIGWRLIRTDTLSNQVVLGSITVTPLPNITGMTWDATTGIMYVITTDLVQSQIGTIDTTTRVVTLIGSPTTACPGAISISAAPNGSLFAIDIINDNFYRFNKTTGVATLVGSLGVSTNFPQDAQFDVDGTLYWAANTLSPQLRSIDTVTGNSTFICSYTSATLSCAIATIADNITAIDPTGTIIPDEYFISQNYPNPFNPVTKIKFGLPNNNNVKLTIYDVIGREIALLVNEFKHAGTYVVDFDGTNLPSGLYFCRLEAGEVTLTKKMLLVK